MRNVAAANTAASFARRSFCGGEEGGRRRVEGYLLCEAAWWCKEKERLGEAERRAKDLERELLEEEEAARRVEEERREREREVKAGKARKVRRGEERSD